VYADTKGNIGWQVGGMTPIRDGWNGLLPIPGDGRYEWKGFRDSGDLPFEFNPPRHYIATSNNNILPPGYSIPLGYDGWAQPFRVNRVREMLAAGKKFTVEDFERMQQDVTSLAARQFQQTVKDWHPATGTRTAWATAEVANWDAVLRAASRAALIYEYWTAQLGADAHPTPEALQKSLDAALAQLDGAFGSDPAAWQWGNAHKLTLRHPLGKPDFNLPPVSRPGDANTVNATSGANFAQTNGASWREVLDVGAWDNSVITNVPGESGNPASKHYGDLLQDWAAGRYHPLPYSRKAVEAAMEERIVLLP